MEIRNCVRCGKLFRSIAGRVHCNECREELDNEYVKVRDYLRKHPNARVFEVAEATGVSVWRIHEFVRAGKLIAISPESDLAVECVQCGTKITTGQLCAACAKKGIESGEPEKETKKVPARETLRGRLHIENRWRRR